MSFQQFTEQYQIDLGSIRTFVVDETI